MDDVATHAVRPVELRGGVGPQLVGELEPRVEQPFEVGVHDLVVTDAQLVVRGGCPADRRDQAMPLRVPVGATKDHGGGARPEGQRGELRHDVPGGGLRTGQPLDGALLDGPGVLPVDDKRVVDDAGIDHGGGQLHAVDEAQTRVRDIEVLTGRRQPEPVVDRHGARGFEELATHRSVHQQPDASAVDAALPERLRSGRHRAVDEREALRPPTPFTDADKPLEQPCPQAHPLVGVRQALVQGR